MAGVRDRGTAAAPTEDAGGVIDRFFSALAQGDIAEARSCCTPDVAVWHSFDRLAQDIEDACRSWTQFVAAFHERAFVDVRRSATSEGFVQQHLMVARTSAGVRQGWPACIVLRLRGGLIARLEEYIDRAGSFPVGDGTPTTPGLQTRRVLNPAP